MGGRTLRVTIALQLYYCAVTKACLDLLMVPLDACMHKIMNNVRYEYYPSLSNVSTQRLMDV